MHCLQSGFHTLRMVGVGGKRTFLDRLRSLRRALDRELAGFPHQVVFADLEQVRGQLPCLVADLARGHRASRAGGWCRAAGIGPEAVWGSIGITLFDLDITSGDAKFLGDDLRVRRLVALTLALGAETRNRLARRVHANFGRVEHLQPENVEVARRTGTDDFGETRNADAHQLAALALL